MPKERKESEPESRKRRLPNPFRIRVGCVVSLRFRAEGNQTVHEASQAFARFEEIFFARKNKTFSNVWCDPKPGYDRGINLVGRYIRCCFPKSVLSGFHVPEASSKFLEGEIVSLVKDEYQKLESSTFSYRQSEGRGTTVDLLVSRDCFKAMPFLSRFRIDSDIDLSLLSESSRRHHLNELRIKGSGKAIVRVVLSGETKPKPDGRLVVRWVIRKRIFVGSLSPFDNYNGGKNAIKMVTSSSQLPKRQKIAESSQLFIGNADDSELQQKANWRWFASNFNPISFAREYRVPFVFLGCTISEVVGEVLRIKPQPADSASLAMVTLKRLVLPEHTLTGRLTHHNDNEIFQDLDAIGQRESESALFDVPIEDVLVISRKVLNQEQLRDCLLLKASYSLWDDKFVKFASGGKQQPDSDDPKNHAFDDSLRLIECPGTRQYNRELVDLAVLAARRDVSRAMIAEEASRTSLFSCTEDLVKHLSELDFALCHDYMPLTSVPSRRRIMKKPKRQPTKRPIDTSLRCHTPSESNGKRIVSLPQSTSPYDNGKNLATCSRTRPSDGGRSETSSIFLELGSSTEHPPEKVRNLRSQSLPLLMTGTQDDAIETNRALRATQRRLIRDVVSIGLNFDSLAGRDHEDSLRFDRSKIHAWGVFADKIIKENKMIVEYRGEIIGNSVAEKREIEYSNSNIGSDYMFRIDANTVCDATKQGNVARFINHSCSPNCITKIISMEGVRRIAIYAKRDIESGEELCYDYKFPIELDGEKRIQCRCGAKFCRGYMN